MAHLLEKYCENPSVLSFKICSYHDVYVDDVDIANIYAGLIKL